MTFEEFIQRITSEEQISPYFSKVSWKISPFFKSKFYHYLEELKFDIVLQKMLALWP